MMGRIHIGVFRAMLTALAVWALTAIVINQAANAQTASAKKDPLFASDDIIKIRIDAPFSTLVRRSKKSTTPYPARLTLEGATPESHAITLAARGKSRRTRGYCKFPPLRVKFTDKPAKTSFFKGQKSLKLVTHCNKGSQYQNVNALEYSIYKMYNVLTPQSLDVRMAQIDYVNTKNGEIYATRYGFFIEDMDDAAKRNGMKELDLPKISGAQLDPAAAARASLFNYMVSNLDFSMTKGPEGSDCCHNGKLMGATKTSTRGLVYVPYDFDQTGFVNAPYATTPDGIKAKSVRTRIYRGYCAHTPAVKAQVASFLQNKDRITRVIYDVSVLDDPSRASAATYLNAFFETLQDPKKMQRNLFNKCRK